MALVLEVILSSIRPGVQVEGARIDIRKYGAGSLQHDGLHRGREGKGSGDDLVVRADLQGHQCDPQGIGARRASHREAGSQVTAQFGLELGHGPAHHEVRQSSRTCRTAASMGSLRLRCWRCRSTIRMGGMAGILSEPAPGLKSRSPVSILDRSGGVSKGYLCRFPFLPNPSRR